MAACSSHRQADRPWPTPPDTGARAPTDRKLPANPGNRSCSLRLECAPASHAFSRSDPSVSFKSLLESWRESAAALRTAKSYAVRLTVDDAARLAARGGLVSGTHARAHHHRAAGSGAQGTGHRDAVRGRQAGDFKRRAGRSALRGCRADAALHGARPRTRAPARSRGPAPGRRGTQGRPAEEKAALTRLKARHALVRCRLRTERS